MTKPEDLNEHLKGRRIIIGIELFKIVVFVFRIFDHRVIHLIGADDEVDEDEDENERKTQTKDSTIAAESTLSSSGSSTSLSRGFTPSTSQLEKADSPQLDKEIQK
jgi:hypothetical protein